MLSSTLLLLLCGVNAGGVFATTRSAGVAMQVEFDGNEAVVEDGSEVFPSISRSTWHPFPVERNCFSASWV